MKVASVDELKKWIKKAQVEQTGCMESEWASLDEKEYIGVEEIVYCPCCGTRSIKSPGGLFIPMIRGFNYCPNCGADMRGDKHEID